MKNFSNTYIFIFSAVMVVLVAALLSFVAMQLKPVQEINIRVETMQNILHSVHVQSTTRNAEELFHQYVTDSYVINPAGERLEGEQAIEVDLKKEVAKMDRIKNLKAQVQEQRVSPFKAFIGRIFTPKQVDQQAVNEDIQQTLSDRKLPVYVVQKDNKSYYVFPLRGKGLWGPVWGFISLEEDMNTVYGAVFDHKTETPGLGAEISQDWFSEPFQGKKIVRDNTFTSIEVVKGGTDASNPYGVDAISGGTITSKGVQAMLYDCLNSYQTFFEQHRN